MITLTYFKNWLNLLHRANTAEFTTVTPLGNFLILLLIAFYTCEGLQSVEAQEAVPSGIIFYKASNLAQPDSAQAMEYAKLDVTSVVLNGVSLTGRAFTLQRNRIVEVIAYPDMNTIRTPQEIEAFKETGRKLTKARADYPLSKSIVTPRLELLSEIANKLNQGYTFVGGVPQAPSDGTLEPATGAMKSDLPPQVKSNAGQGGGGGISVSKVSGVQYSNVRVMSSDDESVRFMHKGGVASVAWSELTPESRNALGYDAEGIAMRQEQKREAIAEENRQRALVEDYIKQIAKNDTLSKEALALILHQRTRKQVEELLGPPDSADGDRWTYWNRLLNPITKKSDFLIINFPNGVARSFGGLHTLFVPSINAYYPMAARELGVPLFE